MLAGLVICKHCGAKYYKSVGHKKLDGTRSEFYVCATRSKKGSSKEQVNRQKTCKCRNKIYRMEELNRMIYEEIIKLSFDPKYIEKIKEDVDVDNEKPRQIELINKRIKELSAQISRYSDLFRISLRAVKPGGSLLLPNISVLNASFEVCIQWGDFEKKKRKCRSRPNGAELDRFDF